VTQEYRILPDEEFDRLRFIFEPKGYPMPDPAIERVEVVEEDGEIIAMAVLRILPLLDALWVDPKHRGGSVDYKKAVTVLEEPFTKYPGSKCYALGLNTLTQRILKDIGYKVVPGNIFEKEF
jgi:hypothetical protein